MGSLLQASYTKWMLLQKPCTSFSPGIIITFLLRGSYLCSIDLLMLFTVFSTGRDKLSASLLLAWDIWSSWHGLFLPRKVFFTEVPIAGDLVVINIRELQEAYDSCWCEVVV